jgi:hypothetical protein
VDVCDRERREEGERENMSEREEGVTSVDLVGEREAREDGSKSGLHV